MTLLERKEGELGGMVLTGEHGKESIDKRWAHEMIYLCTSRASSDVPVHVFHANEVPYRDLKHGLH